MATLDNLAGKRFGRLTVTEIHKSVKRKTFWTCKCDCGGTTEVTATNLKSGNTKSCGCYRQAFTTTRNTTHGLGRPPEYTVWAKMRDRCENSNNPSWVHYGGRGITVCERWSKFENFYADMGTRPTDDHQIDRIDNDGPYAPENCRWATRVENCSNRRNTVKIEWRGEVDTIPGWARKIGIPQYALWMRIRRLGWDLDRAMTEPVRNRPRKSKAA